MTRLLGIDPGLNRTGWGIIQAQGNQLSFVAAGVITTDAKAQLAERLAALHGGLSEVIAAYRPAEAAIEETFVNKSGSSTLKLGQARGALLLTLQLAGLSPYEYAANLVKKTVSGSGHAEKTQISRMVHMLLPGCRTSSADAADALAVAICHASHRGVRGQGSEVRKIL